MTPPWFALGYLVTLVVDQYAPQTTLASFRKELDEEGQRRAREVGVVEWVVMAVALAASVEAGVVGSGAMGANLPLTIYNFLSTRSPSETLIN